MPTVMGRTIPFQSGATGTIAISNQQLDTYSGTEDDVFVASMDVSGSPTVFAVEMNSAIFPLFLVSGTSYRATISGSAIGICSSEDVEFIAGTESLSDCRFASSQITVTAGSGDTTTPSDYKKRIGEIDVEVKFTDDFDTGETVGQPPSNWNYAETNSGTARISTDEARSGANSIKMSTGSGDVAKIFKTHAELGDITRVSASFYVKSPTGTTRIYWTTSSIKLMIQIVGSTLTWWDGATSHTYTIGSGWTNIKLYFNDVEEKYAIDVGGHMRGTGLSFNTSISDPGDLTLNTLTVRTSGASGQLYIDDAEISDIASMWTMSENILDHAINIVNDNWDTSVTVADSVQKYRETKFKDVTDKDVILVKAVNEGTNFAGLGARDFIRTYRVDYDIRTSESDDRATDIRDAVVQTIIKEIKDNHEFISDEIPITDMCDEMRNLYRYIVSFRIDKWGIALW